MREHYGGFATSLVTDVEECVLLRDSSDTENKHPKVAAAPAAVAGPRLRGAELRNVLLLLFLYVLQGVPLGLAGSIPLILQSRNVSYTDQAFFSLVFWPFSLKLLWAPLVDALYVRRVGRRKTWLVPTQYLLGLFMLYLSVTAETLLQGPGGPHGGPGGGPDVVTLTAVFLALAFLAATQDIAVDGWALTMLSRDNVGYASTVNSVGQTAGYFLGNVFFLVLESADFCNKYLRSAPRPRGIVTLSGFLFFWGVAFLVSTTLMALLKKEKGSSAARSSSEREQRSCFSAPPSEKKKQRAAAAPEAEPQGVLQTYRLLYHIVRMPQVSALCGLLLTAKVGFAAAEAVTGLKLIEAGVPKEQLAVLAVTMVPLQLALPLLISRYTAGPRPLDVYCRAFPVRLGAGLAYAALVWWTPTVLREGGGFPAYYYGLLLLAYGLQQGALYSMYVSSMAFYTQVSDPLIGGTYMTLLNTVTNLGGVWPSTLALWLVDPLTVRECRPAGGGAGAAAGGGAGAGGQSCGSAESTGRCAAAGGACVTVLDGYYIEAAVCFALGLAWWAWLGKRMRRLQDQSPTAWRCKMNH